MAGKLRRTSDRIDCRDGIHLTVIDYPDASSLAKYLNDEDIYANTGSIPHPYTLDHAKTFIERVLAFEEAQGVQRDWAIRGKDGEQIGGIGLLYNHGIHAHKTEIGYWLAKPFWNQGIGSMVVQRWTDYILKERSFIRGCSSLCQVQGGQRSCIQP
jgi:RimJ/RimL family protein N-acetyltransferase